MQPFEEMNILMLGRRNLSKRSIRTLQKFWPASATGENDKQSENTSVHNN